MGVVTSLEHPDKQISDRRCPNTIAILLAQATKEMLWWHSCDVGLLVGVCRVRNRIVAIATSLDAVEDDADKDYEEQGAQSGTKCNQYSDAFRMVVACVDVSHLTRQSIITGKNLPPGWRGLLIEVNRLAMEPLWPSRVDERM